MNYALIENHVVVNVISLPPMNASSFPNAVPIEELPVEIGDSYVDGSFYRDGVEVTAPSFADDDTEDMQAALSMLEVRVNG